jgi:transcription antitermination factor NusG
MLRNKNIETYIPIKRELKQWSDRKKWVESVFINSYVFVKTNKTKYNQILATNSVVSFVRDMAKYAIIPDVQMNIMKNILSSISYNPEISYKQFTQSKEYRVIHGPLKGNIVYLSKIKAEKKGIVNIKSLNIALSFDIDLACLGEL